MRTALQSSALAETILLRSVPKKQAPAVRHSPASKNVAALKKLSQLSDDTLADCLEITPKTFRAYKKPGAHMKGNIQERTGILLALFKHGIDVFGSVQLFNAWLETANFHFNNKPPLDDLKKIEGIKYINDRLTGMEYGDNA